jgi:hypothetical protein
VFLLFIFGTWGGVTLGFPYLGGFTGCWSNSVSYFGLIGTAFRCLLALLEQLRQFVLASLIRHFNASLGTWLSQFFGDLLIDNFNARKIQRL